MLKKNRITLFQRLFLLVSSLIVISVSVISIFLLIKINRIMYREFDERGLLLATEFSQRAAESVLIEDHLVLDRIINQMFFRNDIQYILVYGEKQNHLVHKSKGITPKPLDSLRQRTQTSEIRTERLDHNSKTKILDISMPVLYEHEIIGSVQIGISLAKINAEIRDRLSNLSILIVTFIIIGLAISFIFSRSLSKPIRTILAGVQIIGKGNFKHQVAVKRSDEIGELATAINRMTDELQTKTTSIDKLNKEIRERITTEREKEVLSHQLLQSQKLESIGIMASGIAHDFNNMLGAIIGYADILKHNWGEHNPKMAKYINAILSAVRRSTDLTAQLLAFSRKGKYVVTSVNLNTIIHNVIHLLEHSLDKRIAIINTVQAQSPTIIGDVSQLQSVIMNLALNARDSMPDGGKLEFSTRIMDYNENKKSTRPLNLDSGKYVILTVKDTGIGMDEKVMTKIFDPFFTTKSVGQGTGLGLASAYGTIKEHNGIIEVDSKVGEGTCFNIYLPYTEAPETSRPEPSDSLVKGRGTILVVDDEELVRDMAATILEELGYTVYQCANGNEAVAYYRKKFTDIDLIILDLIMPELDGYNCFLQLKKINPQVKAIVSSGYSVHGEARAIMNAGALDFVQKPYDISKLSTAVSQALAQ